MTFTEAGLSLFPEKLRDLQTSCSCPDYSNPCKHIAAVYYLIGEELDRDPFLIFKLRGLDRERLVGMLGEEAGAEAPVKGVPPAAEPLDAQPGAFWQGGELPPGWLGEVRRPPMDAALPRRLGNFPFWRGSERFLDALGPVYPEASERGLNALAGKG